MDKNKLIDAIDLIKTFLHTEPMNQTGLCFAEIEITCFELDKVVEALEKFSPV